VNVNEKDNRGMTPLHNAASHGYVEICKLLLNNGADVNTHGTVLIAPNTSFCSIVSFL
jgi:ankyrin repeat protein